MVTADRRDDLTMLAVARRLLPAIIDRSIEEAEQLDSVGVEVALMRTWLYETIQEQKHLDKEEFTRRLIHDIVRAVSIRYRLGPKDSEKLHRQLSAITAQLHEEAAPPPPEDEDET
jgi:hypothetical protein